MDTTIQLSKNLVEKLKSLKMHEKESYENLIWDLIEDRLALSEETKKNIEISRKQYSEGKTKSWESIKKDLKLNV